MAGITTRVSDEKTLEGGESFWDVNISTWTSPDVESLLLFIGGL